MLILRILWDLTGDLYVDFKRVECRLLRIWILIFENLSIAFQSWFFLIWILVFHNYNTNFWWLEYVFRRNWILVFEDLNPHFEIFNNFLKNLKVYFENFNADFSGFKCWLFKTLILIFENLKVDFFEFLKVFMMILKDLNVDIYIY